MAGSSTFLILACVVLVFMVVADPLAAAGLPSADTMTCSTVNKSLAPCMPYLRGTAKAPPAGCCPKVRALKGMAKTPADRRAACNCLKTVAASMSHTLNQRNAAALPRLCGVTLPYTVSPTVDCSKVK